MWRPALRCVESWSVKAHHAVKTLSLCRAALCFSRTVVSAPPAPLLTELALRQCSISGKADVFNISSPFLQKGLGRQQSLVCDGKHKFFVGEGTFFESLLLVSFFPCLVCMLLLFWFLLGLYEEEEEFKSKKKENGGS
ncbi:hypothetical protein AKJ16_DCAP26420 [Drosera capensis]